MKKLITIAVLGTLTLVQLTKITATGGAAPSGTQPKVEKESVGVRAIKEIKPTTDTVNYFTKTVIPMSNIWIPAGERIMQCARASEQAAPQVCAGLSDYLTQKKLMPLMPKSFCLDGTDPKTCKKISFDTRQGRLAYAASFIGATLGIMKDALLVRVDKTTGERSDGALIRLLAILQVLAPADKEITIENARNTALDLGNTVGSTLFAMSKVADGLAYAAQKAEKELEIKKLAATNPAAAKKKEDDAKEAAVLEAANPLAPEPLMADDTVVVMGDE